MRESKKLCIEKHVWLGIDEIFETRADGILYWQQFIWEFKFKFSQKFNQIKSILFQNPNPIKRLVQFPAKKLTASTLKPFAENFKNYTIFHIQIKLNFPAFSQNDEEIYHNWQNFISITSGFPSQEKLVNFITNPHQISKK